ncbi:MULTISPECIES: hypothetical protein [unclassified Streptomyces]|nr:MULTISPECIES: hypothetical protein [unclassified Streptomyces]
MPRPAVGHDHDHDRDRDLARAFGDPVPVRCPSLFRGPVFREPTA